MSKINHQISGVPTNIITGFLGVGKTTTILQLLKHKPKNQRWAVLVNEFGEIGIDGALLEGQVSEHQGVYIREVAGGCMCCTAGLTMRVALAQLLRRAKPDRLLIEPTGLGHPQEVLHTLMDESFRSVLAVQKILTLVDARHLANCRYLEHETFQQQLAIADVIVGNKVDLYQDSDKLVLATYLQENISRDINLVFTEQGMIEPALLEGGKTIMAENSLDVQLPASEIAHTDDETNIPKCGFIKVVNEGEGYVSIGWRFSSELSFDWRKLAAFLSGVKAQRLKATFITTSGNFAYNLSLDSLTQTPIEPLDQSRIEIISWYRNKNWEGQLFDCIKNKNQLKQINN